MFVGLKKSTNIDMGKYEVRMNCLNFNCLDFRQSMCSNLSNIENQSMENLLRCTYIVYEFY